MFKVAENRNEKGLDQNKTVVKAIQEQMSIDPMVVALEADLGGASGFSAFKKSNPDQFVECGIAEANMVGVAAGMSMLGFKPIVHTFAPFAARRDFDQLFLSGAYAHNTVTVFGSDPGFATAHNGGTHTAWEDVALMRTIPNAVIVDACDATQAAWVTKKFLQLDGIHYFRTNRKALRNVYTPDSTFELGKGNVLTQGDDCLIITAGELLSDVLDAQEELKAKGINCEVIDMFTIKPLDEELIKKEVKGKKAVLTVENASVYGGLGSAVNDVLVNCEEKVHVKNMGVKDEFGQVGSVDYLKKVFHLTKQDIIEEVERLVK